MLSRRNRSQTEMDQEFLYRALNRSGIISTSGERDLITKLINRYHNLAYGDINQMQYSRGPINLETMLDNYGYLMGKIKGGKRSLEEHSEFILRIYDIAPETRCRLRTAPLAVRRKAMVVVRFCRLLEEAVNLPDGCYGATSNYPSTYLIELGMKHWERFDTLLELILDDRNMELPVIDVIMEDKLASPLSGGAL